MNQNLQAIAWMLLTGFLTITIITLGKFLSEPPHSFHAIQVVFFYNALALVFFLPMWLKHKFTLATTRWRLYWTRAALEFFAFTLTFYGVTHLPLPAHTAISFIAPLMGSVTAVLILKEKNYLYRWLALGLGFSGVLIVSRPWRADFEMLPVLAMLGAALCFAFCDVCIKRLTKTEPSPRIAFYMVSMTATIALTAIFGVSLASMLFPAAIQFDVWMTPRAEHIPWLLLLGLMVASVQYAVSKAFSKGDVTLILPFFFFNIVWSSLYAYFLFGEEIDRNTMLGAAVIISATLYAAFEARRKGAGQGKKREANDNSPILEIQKSPPQSDVTQSAEAGL